METGQREGRGKRLGDGLEVKELNEIKREGQWRTVVFSVQKLPHSAI